MAKLIITSGDPAGIGSEVTVKALSSLRIEEVTILVLGDLSLYRSVARRLGVPFEPNVVSNAEEVRSGVNFLQVDPGGFSLDILGKPNEKTARATFNYLLKSVELLKDGFDGVVTAPISKSNLWKVGFRYPGHTEFYADNLGAEKFVMLLAGDRLKVALVTIHVPLRQVPELVTEEGIVDTVRVVHEDFIRSFALKEPRIAVAGLNPHAGEDGRMGTEEMDVILPAIEKLKREGIAVYGPFPPDTLFYRAAKGEFDVVVSMYHDQGLIPLKLLHFDDAVNVTLGLPRVRTSVDHGTAYEIAPMLKANHLSMVNAIRTAILMIENRRRHE